MCGLYLLLGFGNLLEVVFLVVRVLASAEHLGVDGDCVAVGVDGEAVGQRCCGVVDERQFFAPKAASKRLPDGTMVSAPLEDMAPFLPREELKNWSIAD